MANKNRFYADIMALHPEVTGSSILINISFPNGNRKKVLVDCGLFHEKNYNELNKGFPYNPSEIDYVLITHNHVDHTGRLPLLLREYPGKIHMTYGTSKLIAPALYNSASILSTEAKHLKTKPLYTDLDVSRVISAIEYHNFNETFKLNDDMNVTFFMNGHLPGAAIILLQIHYYGYEDINILFTGDYNNKNKFFTVEGIPNWVYSLPLTIIQEATYGTTLTEDIEYVFEKNIINAVKEGKKILIPAFALGRTQEILYILKLLQDQDLLSKEIPIYLDGKLSRSYTNIFIQKFEFDNFLPDNLSFVFDRQMQKDLINSNKCMIIITSSGMGSNGPSRTYIPLLLEQKNVLIHFVGYQAEGTLGRKILDCHKKDTVEIFGIKRRKLATVKFTSECSSHAPQDVLLQFLSDFIIKFLVINHGNIETKDIYSDIAIKQLNPKNVAILDRTYAFRISPYGFVKSFTTKF